MKNKQNYFAKFGEKLIPLKNKRDFNKIALGRFPIITEGENTYVVCDCLLEPS